MATQLKHDSSIAITARSGTATAWPSRTPIRDNLRFLKLWLRRPFSLGAMLPSGGALARAMARQVDPSTPGVVVELGGGTGSISAALLERGVALEELVVIENEPTLVKLLRARFPGMRVIRGDARHTARLVEQTGVGPVKAVVSGLPLLSIPTPVCREIVTQAFAVLGPDRRLVQFTYGPTSPVSRRMTEGLDVAGKRAAWVPDNLPPASVWNYRQRTA